MSTSQEGLRPGFLALWVHTLNHQVIYADLRDPCRELDAFLQIVFIKDTDILKENKTKQKTKKKKKKHKLRPKCFSEVLYVPWVHEIK